MKYCHSKNSYLSISTNLLCHVAPAIVSSGTLTHPCNVDTLLSIPDSPYGTTVQVGTCRDMLNNHMNPQMFSYNHYLV